MSNHLVLLFFVISLQILISLTDAHFLFIFHYLILHLSPLVLQLFLSSPRPTLRFAAVRTLNKVAIMQPTSVTTCNLDLENLITDVNRSIATLAITTLLKVAISTDFGLRSCSLKELISLLLISVVCVLGKLIHVFSI